MDLMTAEYLMDAVYVAEMTAEVEARRPTARLLPSLDQRAGWLGRRSPAVAPLSDARGWRGQ